MPDTARKIQSGNAVAEQGQDNERWWDSRFAQGLVMVSITLLVFSFFLRVPDREQAMLGQMERLTFDLQMRFLRAWFPREAKVEPVLIGIGESAEDAFEEPIAMWHKHFAKTLDALVMARPALVGMDVQMPSRSFDTIKPGLDYAFLLSLFRIKQNVPFVVVHTLDRVGSFVPIHTPYLNRLGDESFALDKVIEDADRVARRYNEREVVKEGSLKPFAGHIARLLGREPGAGYIDFSVGSTIRYIPIQDVIGWLAEGNLEELKRRFEGRVVLIGSVTRSQDRWNLPVALSEWEKDDQGRMTTNQPGVIVHYQTLRSMLGDGLLVPIPLWLKWSVCTLIMGLLFVPSNRRLYAAAGIATFGFFALSVSLITAKILIPAATFVLIMWIAVGVGAAADSARTLLQRNRLRNSFKGSVSPAVLQEILAGNLEGGVSAKAEEICVMFTDIRGFTGISETLPPEQVTSLLTRYFDRMVDCVHKNRGTMDKFMGDGMMVLFGAPKKEGNPCADAVRCGRQMVVELAKLNAEFSASGLPPIAIGIGINYGKVVVGNIGSTERHNYSAIGDAVNVASRVEGLTKRLGQPIVFTDPVKAQLGGEFEMIDFGEQAIRGHSPMRLWSIKDEPAQA
ncbi:MAG: adenylate/guanylate cyclase domain-containing protein [Betaproteobacteria bacterium]|nr:adenylate/guanylate cyclase domain-containing protein [Betaproteobacteria bacterium]